VRVDAPPFETVLPCYPVRDISATRDFYGRDLRLRALRDRGTLLIFAVGGAFVAFTGTAGTESPDEGLDVGLAMTFVTDDVDTWYGRLRRLGIETEGAPRRRGEGHTYHFFARDPDGYRIEIRRLDEPLLAPATLR
jgi:catechol 2,3-dioxygenase-like lactoylglutathione lyase family enzyme